MRMFAHLLKSYQQNSNATCIPHSIAILLIKLGAQAKIPMIISNLCSNLNQQNSNAVLFFCC